MSSIQTAVFRKILLALAFVLLPVAGFAWGFDQQGDHSWVVGGIFVVSAIVAIGAEIFATEQEHRIEVLESELAEVKAHFDAERALQSEKLREAERIVGVLSQENGSLRADLVHDRVSMQGVSA